MGTQGLIEGKYLSIPVVMNASAQLKAIAQVSADGPDNTTSSAGRLSKGQIQFPQDVALFVGGRLGNEVGYFWEMSMMDGDFNNRFSAFRVPIGITKYKTRFQAVPFTTDADGPAYGYETLNAGVLRQALLNFDSTAFGYLKTNMYPGGSLYSAQLKNTFNTFAPDAAMGVAFVISRPLWYLNYTPWKNVHGAGDNQPLNTNHWGTYLRAALTPEWRGWDLGVGINYETGTMEYFNNSDVSTGGDNPGLPNLPRNRAQLLGFDAQAQKIVNGMPVGIYASFAHAPASSYSIVNGVLVGTPNAYNATGTKPMQAFAINGEVGILPQKLVLGTGIRVGHNGDPASLGVESDNSYTVQAAYYMYQNIGLILNEEAFFGNGARALAASKNQPFNPSTTSLQLRIIF
jgi:hypothetical protein